jgi:hypothetical protein
MILFDIVPLALAGLHAIFRCLVLTGLNCLKCMNGCLESK